MRAKQPFHISALNVMALVKDLPNHLSFDIFKTNTKDALNQMCSLYYPKNWHERFSNRNTLEKTISMARYAGMTAFAGMTVNSGLSNGITNLETLGLASATAALVFLFSAQRIETINEIKNSNGEVIKTLEPSSDRMNALLAIGFAATMEQWGYVGGGLVLAASNFLHPSLPNSKEYEDIRKAVSHLCVASAIPLVAAISMAQPELKDKIIQALPIIPISIATYAGMHIDEKVKTGRALHLCANFSMCATGAFMGLGNVVFDKILGMANLGTTIHETDIPIAEKDSGKNLSPTQRIGAWMGVVKDHTKTPNYLYKSDLKPK